MSFNLVDHVKGAIGQAIMSKLAGSLGVSETGVTSAMDSAIPSLLGAMMNKSSAQGGSSELLDFIGKQDFGNLLGGEVGDLLSGGAKTDAITKSGNGILEYLLGGSKATNGFMETFGKFTGMGTQSGGGLLKMAAPFIMSTVGHHIKSQALDAVGLSRFFGEQKSNIMAGIPSALTGNLGLAAGGSSGSTGAKVASSGGSASTGGSSSGGAKVSGGGGGGGLPGWLLPLILALAALFLLRSCFCGSASVPGGDLVGGVGDTMKSGIGAVGDVAGGAADMVGDVAGGAADMAKDAAGAVGDVAGGAADMVGDAAGAVGDVAGGAADMVGDAAGAMGDAAQGAMDKAGDAVASLGSLTLPGGQTIETPEGSFTTKVAEYLGSSGASTEPVNFDFDGVNFQTGSANITAESMRQLNNLASLMTAYPNSAIRVEGHTDNTGNAAANKTLSEKRAASVKQTLMDKGIAGDRLESAGFGQESPIASNDTDEGRAQNRRVSVVITRK